MLKILRLIRIRTLIFTVFVMGMVRYFVMEPLLLKEGFFLQMPVVVFVLLIISVCCLVAYRPYIGSESGNCRSAYNEKDSYHSPYYIEYCSGRFGFLRELDGWEMENQPVIFSDFGYIMVLFFLL